MKIGEGVTQFTAVHRMSPLPTSVHDQALPGLSAWRTILAETGLIGLDPQRYDGVGFGNVSLRVGPFPGQRGRRPFIISGTQTGGAQCVTPQSFALVEAYCSRSNTVRSTGPVAPSSESLTHGAIYDLGGHIRCVLHVHSPVIWTQADALQIPSTQPGIGYGTPEMAGEMSRLSRESTLWERRVLAMTGHEDGIIAFGRSLNEAGGALMTTLASAHERRFRRSARACMTRRFD